MQLNNDEVLRQVSLEYFTQSLLPQLPINLNLNAVVERLSTQYPKTVGKGAFSKCTSSAKNEDATPQFEAVAVSIQQAALHAFPSLKQHVVFKFNSTVVSNCSLRSPSSRPDSYGQSTRHCRYEQQSNLVQWEIVVVAGEQKEQSTPETITENNSNILWSLHQMMGEDVRRRFVFGYTIENCNMRLWFGSRADLLVSESFDFTKDHKTLVHFILSFMYAKDESLGYDTTMKPVISPGGVVAGQHDITVRGLDGRIITYRTVRIISNSGAVSIRGRGTRVWEAKRLKNGRPFGKSVALKDTWIDDDREREGIIVNSIKSSAKTEEQCSTLTQSLLTVLAHGDVYIDEKQDQTHTLLRRNNAVPQDLEHYPLKASRDSNDGECGTIRTKERQEPVLLDYGIKAHYRIVFEEVGESIEALNKVGEIFEMLTEALFAVEALHQLGWLHRDISSGNLLVYEGHVKVTDFEYAKRANDKSDSHNLRTGTAHFMAVEADKYTWCFLPVPEVIATEVPLDPRTVKARWQAWKANRNNYVAQTRPGDTKASIKLPAFRHIALHDLESIWWLAVYLTLARSIVVAVTEKGVQYYRAHRQFYDKMFSQTSCRYLMFNHTGQFSAGEESVHYSMLRVAKGLEDARKQLVAEYYRAEKDIDGITHEVGVTVIARMQNIFLEMAIHYTDNSVKLQSFRRDIPQRIPEPAAPITPCQSLDQDSPSTVLLGKRGRGNGAGPIALASNWDAGAFPPKPFVNKRARQDAASAVLEGNDSFLQCHVEFDASVGPPPRPRSPYSPPAQ